MIIFTHIPKTAGTSFIRRILKKNCNQIEERFHKRIGKKDMKDYKNHDCLAGHFSFGIHEKIGMRLKDCEYVTFIRNPIARWISAFQWHVGRRRKSKTKSTIGQNKNTDVVMIRRMWKKGCGKDIIQFIKWCIYERRNTDMMTVQIAGVETMLPKYIWYKRPKFTDRDMREQLEMAKHNISKYKFVGSQKNADIYFEKFCEDFGFEYHAEGKREVRSRRSRKIDFKDPEVLDLLRECNKYDLELFDYIASEYNFTS